MLNKTLSGKPGAIQKVFFVGLLCSTNELSIEKANGNEMAKASDKTTKYSAPALDKGLDIIELLSLSEDELLLKDIAERLGRSPNEIFRMVMTLVERGYVSRSRSNDRYSLSLKLYATALRRPLLNRFLQHAIPQMRELTLASWQSCHIAMEDNGDIVVVASVTAPGNWGLALRTGSVIGLHNTGSGRVLAAFRDPNDLELLIKSHRLAAGEPKFSAKDLTDRLQAIRERGYEIAGSDTTVGVTNLAFPVFDSFGNAAATVNCPFVTRKDDIEVPSLDEVVKMYAKFAEDLSKYFHGERNSKH